MLSSSWDYNLWSSSNYANVFYFLLHLIAREGHKGKTIQTHKLKKHMKHLDTCKLGWGIQSLNWIFVLVFQIKNNIYWIKWRGSKSLHFLNQSYQLSWSPISVSLPWAHSVMNYPFSVTSLQNVKRLISNRNCDFPSTCMRTIEQSSIDAVWV